MNRLTRLLSTASALAAWLLLAPAAQAADAPAACPATLQHTFPRLQDEKPQSLCQYSGKVVLVVNTASFCGFTGQYKGLEELYARYKDKGLVVLGFPSNDFAQEKGSNKEIADFCENTFGVKFPMFAKSSVKARRPRRCTSSWRSCRARRPAGTSTNTCWGATASWWTTTPA